MRNAQIYRVFLKAALKQVRDARAAYDADVKDWYENGEGRPANWVRAGDLPDFNENLENPDRMVNLGGLGHTYPVCIHGSSLWTDYDNICGGCEDSLTDLQEASIAARTNWIRFCDMWEWTNAAPAAVPHEIRQTLVDITVGLFPKEK